MNSQNDTTPQQQGITGETVLAIISVALAALWIAFAYYKGGSTDVNGDRILLLHPLVPIAIIVLLIRIYRWVGIKFVVHLEIIMIGLWLFIRMLGVFMPFILGFGFAYLLRFLWRALPFKKYYQRTIATVLIILICSAGLVFTGIGVSNQIGQMTKGLQKFNHETLLPTIVGENFQAMAIDVTEKTKTVYLGTDHGIYFIQIDKDAPTKKEKSEKNKIGITNGELVGKKIKAIAVSDKYIYAGTENAVYRCSKEIVNAPTISPTEELIWTKIDPTFFDRRTVTAINVPSWDPNLIYVGTEEGLYKGVYTSSDLGPWEKETIDDSEGRSIVSIYSIEKFDGTRKVKKVYVVSRIQKPKKSTNGSAQQKDTNTETNSQTTTDTDKINDDSTAAETKNDEKAEETQNPKRVITQVHWRKANSTDWEDLNPNAYTVPEIQAIVDADKQGFELYAGTTNGMHERNTYPFQDWEHMKGTTRLPKSVSLLVSIPSELYAGDQSVIHYRSKGTEKWKKFFEKKQGILIYRDAPIVKQFQEYLTEKIPGWTASGGALIRWISGLAGTIAFQFGGFVATVFLAFIIFVYASQGLDRYFHGFMSLIPERHREIATAYLREIDTNMHQFLKGQFTVIVIVSILSCIVYRVVGVPFALLVGILAGFCNAIPTFGPFIGGGFAYIAMLMGLAAGEFTTTLSFLIRCVLVLGAILGIQTIDNSLISPKVMSNAVDVDPLLILFAVIVGASILGFWGVLLAIPIIVVIKSIVAVSKSTANDTEVSPAQEQT